MILQAKWAFMLLLLCISTTALRSELALIELLLLPAVAAEPLARKLFRASITAHGDIADASIPSALSGSSSGKQDGKDNISKFNLVEPELARGLASVASQMRYWSSANLGNTTSLQANNNTKFLLFDIDVGGLNNIRIGWEVAGVIALQTGRTLILPPATALYLIDRGPTYFHPPIKGSKSKMEDFINLSQLQLGLPALSFNTFRTTHSKELGIDQDLSDQEVLNAFESHPEIKTISPSRPELCDLFRYQYEREHKFLYVKHVKGGRLFSCSRWWDLGQPELTFNEHAWPLSALATSLLQNNFVWHEEVFELAAPIVNDLGILKYNSLHARYGDLQFKTSKQPAESIAAKWFLSDRGRKLFGNNTLYIATDNMGDSLIQAFRQRVIVAKWSKDYFENPNSPIAGLIKQKGALRIHQLKGPVEQLVCAFGKIFLGTKFSTFSGHINQLRMRVQAMKHLPLQTQVIHHTDTF